MAARPHQYSETSKTSTIHGIHCKYRATSRIISIRHRERDIHIKPSQTRHSRPRKANYPVPIVPSIPILSETRHHSRQNKQTDKHKRIKLSQNESVLVVGVLLRGPAVFLRVGLLGLALQRAIGTKPVSLFLEDACGAKLVRRSSPDARAKRCPGGAEVDIPPLRGAGRKLQRPF
jgi:hypothetical protein